MGTEPTTLNLQPSDLLKGKLQPFEVKKSRRKNSAKQARSDHLSISEYQQLIVHLHKTIEKTEQQRLALEEENQQLARRCRIQRRLVTYLRGVVTANTSQLSACEGQLQLSGNQPIASARTQRVVSLNGALQKISGVETIEQATEPSELVAAIDPQDLQSIDELEPMRLWQRLPQTVMSAVTASGRSVISIAKSAGDRIVCGVQSILYQSLADQGSGWYQHAQKFVLNKFRAS